MLKMAYFRAYWALFCIKVALVTEAAGGTGKCLVRIEEHDDVWDRLSSLGRR